MAFLKGALVLIDWLTSHFYRPRYIKGYQQRASSFQRYFVCTQAYLGSMNMWPTNSVTRFGKIATHWLYFEGSFSIWLKFEPTLHGANFIFANGQILKNNLAIWTHCLQRPCKTIDCHYCLSSSCALSKSNSFL